MHTLHSSPPCAALKRYVRAFAQRELDHTGAEVVQPMPACLEQIIEFEFGTFPILEFSDGSSPQTYQTVVVGPSANRRATIRLCGGLQSFAIFFQPLAIWQLFGIPGRELADRHYDCCDVIGSDIRRLWNEMAEQSSFEARVKLAEAFLLEKAVRSLESTPIMSAALYMFRHNGNLRINQVANHTALGIRQFERRFSNEIGMSPKLFSRVTRFQMALDSKVISRHSSWLNLAHEFGYHDQMHMIRDFQGLSGFSPDSLLERLGDMRPPALAAAER